MSSTVRKIVSSYIVYCENKPVIMTDDKKKADALMEIAASKDKPSFYKQVNGTEERIKEIGKNIFHRIKNMPKEEIRKILKHRNSVIREWMDYRDDRKLSDEVAWSSICKKYNYQMTLSEFNQWVLDVVEYVGADR